MRLLLKSLLVSLSLVGCFVGSPYVPPTSEDLTPPVADVAPPPAPPDMTPTWTTEVFDDTHPYKVRLDWIPTRTKTVVAFVCGLGYRCGGDREGRGYFSKDLLQRVRDLGIGTALIDLTGSGEARRDPGDLVGLVERARELSQVRSEVLSMFDVVYVGHGFGGATALRAAAVHGGVKGVASLGFVPYSSPPFLGQQQVDDLLAQGQYLKLPPELRANLHFFAIDPDRVAADLAVQDEFPRQTFRDMLSLYQDQTPLQLGKLQVLDLTRIPIYFQAYARSLLWRPTMEFRGAREDLIQATGHAAEFHQNAMETRLALVGWLSQFAR